MCDQCDNLDNTPPHSRFTRRAFLGLAAAATGFTVALLSCQPESKPRNPKNPLTPSTTSTEPTTITSTTSAPATTEAISSAPATTTAAITSPCPDLGSALFPDPRGNPLAAAADCPLLIIPRTNWTSHAPNLNDIRPMNGISRLTVHHTGWNLTTDAWKPTATDLENVRAFHAGSKPTDRNWADIAYHFVIDRAGRVWQARPLAYQGAHAKDHNEHNLGICLLGNFETQSPAAAQLWSLATLITFTRSLYSIPLPQIFTHRELRETACPGKNLQTYMNRARKKWATE